MSDPTQTPDDEFSAAFADLQKPAAGNTPASTPAAAAAPAAPAEAAVSPSASAPAGKDAPAAAAAAPSGETENASAASGAATPAASAEASTTTADQPAGTPASDAQAPAPAPAPAAQPDYAAQIAALTAQLEELKKTPAAETPAPAPTPAPVYTDDEKKIVEDYLKEWPDTARGEALLRRAEYQQLVGYVIEQFRPRLEALEAGYQTSSTRTQYQDIVALVPDYDDVRDRTLAWIDTQPAYLKAAYQQVANEGSAKDVADLITRFKKETNYVAAAAAPAPTPAPAAGGGAVAPAAPAGGLAPAAAAAAASLKVVKTSRTEPVSAPDPNDFDAAFKEFASAG